MRRASSFNTERIDGIYQDPHEANRSLFLHYGDLSNGVGIVNLLRDVRP
jgi:GDPmannose 4,6-dehydratase